MLGPSMVLLGIPIAIVSSGIVVGFGLGGLASRAALALSSLELLLLLGLMLLILVV